MSYMILLFNMLLQNVEMADVLRSEGKPSPKGERARHGG